MEVGLGTVIPLHMSGVVTNLHYIGIMICVLKCVLPRGSWKISCEDYEPRSRKKNLVKPFFFSTGN